MLKKVNFNKERLAFILSKSNLYNGIIQAFTIGINLLLMPVLLNVLDKTRFGVWQTILSFIGYVSLLNFGMGNGLRNTVAKYYVKDDFNAIGNLTGQTILKLGKIILLFSVISLPLYFIFFNPNLLFKDISFLALEVKEAIGIFLFFFLVNIIASLASSLAFGLNKSYFPGFFNVIYLFIVYVVLKVIDQGNLIIVSYLFGGLQLLINIAFFSFLLIKYKIKLSFHKEYQLKETTKLSGQFFIVQLLSIIFLTADNFIVSHLLGPNQTAEYAIVSKVYFTLISVYSILLISFWNGVTIAHERKDIAWIKGGIKQLLLTSLGVLLGGVLIAFLSNFILKIWFGKSISMNIPQTTFLLFSLFAFLHCVNAVFINLQNGIGDIKVQIISTTTMIFIMILGVATVNISSLGYNALIIIKIIAVLIGILINWKSLKRLNVK